MEKELKKDCYKLHSKSTHNLSLDHTIEKAQDQYLLELVEYFGKDEWNLIYRCLKKKFPEYPKTIEESKQKWKELGETQKNSNHFNSHEELELIRLHNVFHNNWIKLGIQLGNKKPNQVKNHFYSLFRKTIRRILKNKINRISSKLHQLQILYNVELIENYLQFPEKMKSLSTNKKNKNYIMTLIKSLSLDKLSNFKDNFKDVNQIETFEKLLIETEKSLKFKNNLYCIPKSTPVELNLLVLPNDSSGSLYHKGIFQSSLEKLSQNNIFNQDCKNKVKDSVIISQVCGTSLNKGLKEKSTNIKKHSFSKTTFQMISNFYT